MKPLPEGILNDPKAEQGGDKGVNLSRPTVKGGSGSIFGRDGDIVHDSVAFPLKSAGTLSPKGPEARRSESVGQRGGE